MTDPAQAHSPQAHIDAASSQLTRLGGLPTAAHPEVYENVHRALQEALADTDAR